jgi:hypothetical protein
MIVEPYWVGSRKGVADDLDGGQFLVLDLQKRTVLFVFPLPETRKLAAS